MTSTSAMPPLDRSTERLAVGALTLAGFGIATNVQVTAPLGPFLLDELNIDGSEFADLVSMGWLAAAAGALALLPIVDRIGRRLPLLLGLALFAIASSAHLMVGSWASLLAVRALTGFAGGVVFTVASAAVADLVPYQRRGSAMGLFNLSLFLALPVGMPLAAWFAEAGIWSTFFLIQTATSVLALVVLARCLPPGLGRGSGGIPWQVLSEPGVVPALLSMMIYSGVFATVVQLLGVWLDGAAIVDKSDQKPVWIGLGLLSALGAVWLARYSDRIGKKPFVVLTTAVVGAGLFALPFVSSGPVLLLVGVPIALCTAARSGAMLALVSGLVSNERRGSLLAIRSAAINLGMGAVVYAGGELFESRGFATLAVSAGIAVVVSLLLVVWAVREVGK